MVVWNLGRWRGGGRRCSGYFDNADIDLFETDDLHGLIEHILIWITSGDAIWATNAASATPPQAPAWSKSRVSTTPRLPSRFHHDIRRHFDSNEYIASTAERRLLSFTVHQRRLEDQRLELSGARSLDHTVWEIYFTYHWDLHTDIYQRKLRCCTCTIQTKPPT